MTLRIRLRGQPGDVAGLAAMRTYRRVRPPPRLEPFASFLGILKLHWLSKVYNHDVISHGINDLGFAEHALMLNFPEFASGPFDGALFSSSVAGSRTNEAKNEATER